MTYVLTHSIVVSLSIHQISIIVMDVLLSSLPKTFKIGTLKVPILNVGVIILIEETFVEVILDLFLSS